jgi:hypothetical protein
MSKSTADSRSHASSPSKKNMPSHLYKGLSIASTKHSSEGAQQLKTPQRKSVTTKYILPLHKGFFNGGKASDFILNYEETLNRRVSTIQRCKSASKLGSSMRNPIFNIDSDPNSSFMQMKKRFPESASKTSLAGDTRILFLSKNRGEFSPQRTAHPDTRQRIERGIKCFDEKRSHSEHEIRRPTKKTLVDPNKQEYNPIHQEGRNTNEIKQRDISQHISSETQKLNNSKVFLASDVGGSKRGRVFAEQNYNLATISEASTKPSTPVPEKATHPLELRLKGTTAKAAIYYDGYKLPERAPIDKCHTKPKEELMKHRDEHTNLFLRRKPKFD